MHCPFEYFLSRSSQITLRISPTKDSTHYTYSRGNLPKSNLIMWGGGEGKISSRASVDFLKESQITNLLTVSYIHPNYLYKGE